MICSFSIQIICVLSFMVMFMFLIAFNIIFWWMAFLKICFPIPVPASKPKNPRHDRRHHRPLRPGLSFPPRVGPDGAMVWSTGELNVRECICTILRTRPGERVEMPDVRLRAAPLPLRAEHRRHPAADQRGRAASPRAVGAADRLDDVTATVNPAEPRAVDVTVSYTLVATGSRERLTMTVGLNAQERRRDHPDPGRWTTGASTNSSPRPAPGSPCTRRSGPTSTSPTPASRIVELFAFLTENLLYRSNRIPEANRLKFLTHARDLRCSRLARHRAGAFSTTAGRCSRRSPCRRGHRGPAPARCRSSRTTRWRPAGHRRGRITSSRSSSTPRRGASTSCSTRRSWLPTATCSPSTSRWRSTRRPPASPTRSSTSATRSTAPSTGRCGSRCSARRTPAPTPCAPPSPARPSRSASTRRCRRRARSWRP